MNKELKNLIETVESEGQFKIFKSQYCPFRWIIFDKKNNFVYEEGLTPQLLKLRLKSEVDRIELKRYFESKKH